MHPPPRTACLTAMGHAFFTKLTFQACHRKNGTSRVNLTSLLVFETIIMVTAVHPFSRTNTFTDQPFLLVWHFQVLNFCWLTRKMLSVHSSFIFKTVFTFYVISKIAWLHNEVWRWRRFCIDNFAITSYFLQTRHKLMLWEQVRSLELGSKNSLMKNSSLRANTVHTAEGKFHRFQNIPLTGSCQICIDRFVSSLPGL